MSKMKKGRERKPAASAWGCGIGVAPKGKQPFGAKAHFDGQGFGEMEVWAWLKINPKFNPSISA